MVLGSDPEKDSLIFHRAEWLPENMEMCPRYVYIPYSNNRERDAFGTYTDYRETTAGNQVMASALLQTDAVIEGDGTIVPKENEVNVYYKTRGKFRTMRMGSRFGYLFTRKRQKHSSGR